MMNGKTTSNGDLNVLDVIGIIFVTLKIIGEEPVAGWPWWLVLLPAWIYIGMLAIVAIAAFVAWCIIRKN